MIACFEKLLSSLDLILVSVEEFKQDISVRCNPVMKSSRQMTIDDFMDQSRDFSETFQRQSEVRSGIF